MVFFIVSPFTILVRAPAVSTHHTSENQSDPNATSAINDAELSPILMVA
jgi:hypothetical protein